MDERVTVDEDVNLDVAENSTRVQIRQLKCLWQRPPTVSYHQPSTCGKQHNLRIIPNRHTKQPADIHMGCR